MGLYERRAHFVQATLFRKVSIFVCLVSTVLCIQCWSTQSLPLNFLPALTVHFSLFFHTAWEGHLLLDDFSYDFLEKFSGVLLLTRAGHLTCGIYICLPFLISDHCGEISVFLMLCLAYS